MKNTGDRLVAGRRDSDAASDGTLDMSDRVSLFLAKSADAFTYKAETFGEIEEESAMPRRGARARLCLCASQISDPRSLVDRVLLVPLAFFRRALSRATFLSLPRIEERNIGETQSNS